jgi:ribosomal protein S27AE
MSRSKKGKKPPGWEPWGRRPTKGERAKYKASIAKEPTEPEVHEAEIEVSRMGCPDCGQEQLCPCKSCAPSNKGKIVWKHLPHNRVACGKCGYTEHGNWWLDREWEHYKTQKRSEAEDRAEAFVGAPSKPHQQEPGYRVEYEAYLQGDRDRLAVMSKQLKPIYNAFTALGYQCENIGMYGPLKISPGKCTCSRCNAKKALDKFMELLNGKTKN